MTDQQRLDSLGCYGSEFAQTPNIDALAEAGVRFDNCYVQNPFSCPSRHSMLTGRYPHCHGVRANWYRRKPDETSFAHQLSRGGYRSAIIGKMHLTPWYENFGFDGRIVADGKGFPYEDDYARFLQHHGRSREDTYDKTDVDFKRMWSTKKSSLPQELHIDTFVGRAACDYLQQTEDPFCLVASFPGPHNPFDPPEPYNRLHLDTEFPPPNMTPGEVDRKPREAYDYITCEADKIGACHPDKLSEEDLHLMKAHYHANVTQIDDWVGELIATLKETGQYDNTVIFYISDHGDMLGDHGLIFKQCFYEESVKVPFIIHCPARFEPGSSPALVESIDLFNTICDLGDVWEGEGRQGRSLLPMLEDPALRSSHRDAAFAENYFGRMVRNKTHKLVYYPGQSYGELYDMDADPQEQNNLWDAPEAGEIKAALKNRLLEWAFASEDPCPQPPRKSHFEPVDPHLHMEEGKAVENERQPWHLDHMRDFYKTWTFDKPGTLR